jgi:D-glycero-D-manno-heptose 1,7-bisphosphate phosphatase
MERPAVFLDRDGTLNVEKGHLYRFEDWEWIPGAIEAIKVINSMGYLAIVVSNQGGIARGYYNADQVRMLHRAVDGLLISAGARIDAYYFCPHHPEHGDSRWCSCRKPEPGMLFQAKQDFKIDLMKSWLIGDKQTDVEAALRASVSPILVKTGYGGLDGNSVYPVHAPDVLSAVQEFLGKVR